MSRCPDCAGVGNNTAILCGRGRSTIRQVNCSLCGGTGEISAEVAERVRQGRELRADRIGRGLSQREEALRLGITPQALSHLEHGRPE